jgi:hypothetical protein
LESFHLNIITMLGRPQNSLYLQPNKTLLEEKSMGNTSIMSEDASDKSAEQPCRRGHATILEMVDQKVGSEHAEPSQYTDDSQRTELQLFGSEQNMSTLQDLSNLLYTRERLQELGCTFTPQGELSTFGDSTRLREVEQLLRLGPIYDEQWTMFFNSGQTPVPEEEVAMWSDMRTLKRVLANEGVTFGADHQRLNHGGGSAKPFRLCAAYDDLYKLWSASIPARTLTPMQESEQDDSMDDSGCYMDEESDRLAEGADDLPIQPASTGDFDDSKVNLPRNIGWRFSDDVTPLANAQNCDSTSDDEIAEMEADLAVAVATMNNGLAGSSFTMGGSTSTGKETSLPVFPPATLKPPARPAFQTRLRHGPSPLQVSCGCTHKASEERLTKAQNVATSSVESLERLMTESRGNTFGSLESVGRMNAASRSTTSLRKSAEAKGEGKKNRKGWWRSIFGKTSDQIANEKYNHVGGWW